jgi:hypothetical protein
MKQTEEFNLRRFRVCTSKKSLIWEISLDHALDRSLDHALDHALDGA